MRYLIINADGYGFTAGVSRAIEECIAFGTVRSLSANVNFKHADGLAQLVRTYPELSVGCRINPVVGCPVLDPDKVPTLLDENGEFLYKAFSRRFMSGSIRLAELRAEMLAQVEKTRDLAGATFSHLISTWGCIGCRGSTRCSSRWHDKVGSVRSGRIDTGWEWKVGSHFSGILFIYVLVQCGFQSFFGTYGSGKRRSCGSWPCRVVA